MISLQSLVMLVILLIVGGLIFWLLTWLVDYCGIPEPFHKIAKIVLAIVAVIFICAVLLSLAGVQVFRP